MLKSWNPNMFTLFNSTKSKTFRKVRVKIKRFRTIPPTNIRLLRPGFSLNLILMTVNLEYRICKIHFLLLKVYTLLIKKSIIIVSTLFNIVLISVFQLWCWSSNLYNNVMCIHLYIAIPLHVYFVFIYFNMW